MASGKVSGMEAWVIRSQKARNLVGSEALTVCCRVNTWTVVGLEVRAIAGKKVRMVLGMKALAVPRIDPAQSCRAPSPRSRLCSRTEISRSTTLRPGVSHHRHSHSAPDIQATTTSQ